MSEELKLFVDKAKQCGEEGDFEAVSQSINDSELAVLARKLHAVPLTDLAAMVRGRGLDEWAGIWSAYTPTIAQAMASGSHTAASADDDYADENLGAPDRERHEIAALINKIISGHHYLERIAAFVASSLGENGTRYVRAALTGDYSFVSKVSNLAVVWKNLASAAGQSEIEPSTITWEKVDHLVATYSTDMLQLAVNGKLKEVVVYATPTNLFEIMSMSGNTGTVRAAGADGTRSEMVYSLKGPVSELAFDMEFGVPVGKVTTEALAGVLGGDVDIKYVEPSSEQYGVAYAFASCIPVANKNKDNAPHANSSFGAVNVTHLRGLDKTKPIYKLFSERLSLCHKNVNDRLRGAKLILPRWLMALIQHEVVLNWKEYQKLYKPLQAGGLLSLRADCGSFLAKIQAVEGGNFMDKAFTVMQREKGYEAKTITFETLLGKVQGERKKLQDVRNTHTCLEEVTKGMFMDKVYGAVPERVEAVLRLGHYYNMIADGKTKVFVEDTPNNAAVVTNFAEAYASADTVEYICMAKSLCAAGRAEYKDQLVMLMSNSAGQQASYPPGSNGGMLASTLLKCVADANVRRAVVMARPDNDLPDTLAELGLKYVITVHKDVTHMNSLSMVFVLKRKTQPTTDMVASQAKARLIQHKIQKFLLACVAANRLMDGYRSALVSRPAFSWAGTAVLIKMCGFSHTGRDLQKVGASEVSGGLAYAEPDYALDQGDEIVDDATD